jgi:hypothetical protein
LPDVGGGSVLAEYSVNESDTMADFSVNFCHFGRIFGQGVGHYWPTFRSTFCHLGRFFHHVLFQILVQFFVNFIGQPLGIFKSGEAIRTILGSVCISLFYVCSKIPLETHLFRKLLILNRLARFLFVQHTKTGVDVMIKIFCDF